ncbi:armadillo-type protein [Pilobolus umbonatus]|nr:armadillo-type protein [Pilobolus umbonatus]
MTSTADSSANDLSQKLANLSIRHFDYIEDIYREIMTEDLNEYKNRINSNTIQTCLSGLKKIRKYLNQDVSVDRIQNILDLQILDVLKRFLEEYDNNDLKYETSWIITNLAFGAKKQTEYLLAQGIGDALIKCFYSTNNFDVLLQTAWALGNIVVDSIYYREVLAQFYLIDSIANLLMDSSKRNASEYNIHSLTERNEEENEKVRTLTWTLANICRNGYDTCLYSRQFINAYHALSFALHSEEESIWSEACWGLSRILGNMHECPEFFEGLHISQNHYVRLIDLLRNEHMGNILPVLQTISNLSSGPNIHTERLISVGLLDCLSWCMLPNTPSSERRNAFLTVANICAGSEDCVDALLNKPAILESILDHMVIPAHVYDSTLLKWIYSSSPSIYISVKTEWIIFNETLWILNNMSASASDKSLWVLLNTYPTIIHSLINILQYPKLYHSSQLKVIDLLLQMLRRTNKIYTINPFARLMSQYDLLEVITPNSSEVHDKLNALFTLSKASTEHDCEVAGIANALESFSIGQSMRRVVQYPKDGSVHVEDAISHLTL